MRDPHFDCHYCRGFRKPGFGQGARSATEEDREEDGKYRGRNSADRGWSKSGLIWIDELLFFLCNQNNILFFLVRKTAGHKDSGLMRLGCLPWIIAIALIVGGGQSFYTGLTNRKLVEVGITDFDPAKNDSKWLKITGGELDIINASYEASKLTDIPKEVYVPLVAPGVDSTESPIQILFKTKDEEVIGLLKELKKADEETGGDPMKAIQAMVAIGKERLRPQRDIEGLVQFGIDSDSGEDKVRKLYDNLAENSVVIENGKKPSMMLGLLMLVVGLVIVGFLVKGMKTKEVSMPSAMPKP